MGAHLDRARLLFDQDRYDLAEAELRKALAEEPDDPASHCLLAFSLSRGGKPDEALESAKTAVSLAPDWAHAHFTLGKIHGNRDEYAKADAALRESIRLDPTDVHARWVRGAVLFDWGKRDDAIAEVDAGLRLDPEVSGLHSLRGLILYGLDRVGEAEAAFRTALRIDPRNDVAHAGLGRIEASRGRADAAVERYREALRLDPNDAWARSGLLDALRARYPVYGLFLRYFEWTRRLSPRTRTVLFVGLYLVFRYAGKAAKDAEGPLRWALLAVAVGYVLFALMSWIADPLFNLLLRLRPEGRLLLDRDE
ncbi:MAG TPA: tetratricopeptide repeat protein, partial [Planctomycetota bacterium]|nr:tetratricopeptide repeat protein [Planctomycetota bacterium]